MVLNMKQFNGVFSFCYCESEGETATGNPLHRYWLYATATDTRFTDRQRSFQQNSSK